MILCENTLLLLLLLYKNVSDAMTFYARDGCFITAHGLIYYVFGRIDSYLTSAIETRILFVEVKKYYILMRSEEKKKKT